MTARPDRPTEPAENEPVPTPGDGPEAGAASPGDSARRELAGDGSEAGVASPGSARRELAAAVVACAAGAGLALLAATRTWSTSVTLRAAPLPPERVAHTGAHLLGWLVAVALVGLAGAGALVATRGPVRRVVGVLVVLAGLGMGAAGVRGLWLTGGAARAWPVLVAAGGFAVAWGGASALRRGAAWPAMGARYERGGTAAAPAGRARDRGDAGMWDDIDRGVDPTIDEPSRRRGR